jgi:hypothetical protein
MPTKSEVEPLSRDSGSAAYSPAADLSNIAVCTSADPAGRAQRNPSRPGRLSK